MPQTKKTPLAQRNHRDYSHRMSPNILIRDVHPDVHSVLTARAATAGQSLQEYLLGLVSDVAQRPTLEEILAQSETETPPLPSVSSEAIVGWIREGREERNRV
jgi:hypothetical protein